MKLDFWVNTCKLQLAQMQSCKTDFLNLTVFVTSGKAQVP